MLLARDGSAPNLEEDLIGLDVGARLRDAVSSSENRPGAIRGCGRVEELPNLTAEMVRRGFTADEIAQVLGLNFMKVFERLLS
jgi:microsomal dipeptidase-like Zn-dependent dipeptidase